MTSVDEWAEVLAIAAGPWKRKETRELATGILEHVQVETAEDALRAARQQLRWEVQRCVQHGEDTAPLLRAMRRLAMLKPETVVKNALRRAFVLPRQGGARELA